MKTAITALSSLIASSAAIGIALAAPAHAEPVNRCDYGDLRTAVAEGHTSCAFAHNVRVAWFTQPGSIVTAYSPETGQLYNMMCVRGVTLNFADGEFVTGATRCVDAEGGSAVAYIW
jgi:hypothetical protein